MKATKHSTILRFELLKLSKNCNVICKPRITRRSDHISIEPIAKKSQLASTRLSATIRVMALSIIRDMSQTISPSLGNSLILIK